MTTFTWLLSIATALDVVAAALVLAAPWPPPTTTPGPRRIGAGRVLLAWLVAGCVFAGKLPFLRVLLDVNAFGAIHLLFLDLAVGLPLTCAALLVLDGVGRVVCRRGALVLAVLGLAGAPLGAYARFIEPRRLQVETVAVPLDPARAGRRPLRIGVLADLQTDRVTGYEHRAVQALLDLDPDLILLPGDIFQGSIPALEAELPALRRLLGTLRAPAGVYLVQGNVDWTSHLPRLVEGTGIELLRDARRTIEVGDRRITLAGLGLAVHAGDRGGETIADLEREPGDDDIRIVLTHYPDRVFELTPHSRIDLVVAGHTHGGQVSVPLLGPPITLSRVPRPVAAGGLHTLGGRRIFVSRGVGLERGQAPRIRFLCPPAVHLLVLE